MSWLQIQRYPPPTLLIPSHQLKSRCPRLRRKLPFLSRRRLSRKLPTLTSRIAHLLNCRRPQIDRDSGLIEADSNDRNAVICAVFRLHAAAYWQGSRTDFLARALEEEDIPATRLRTGHSPIGHCCQAKDAHARVIRRRLYHRHRAMRWLAPNRRYLVRKRLAEPPLPHPLSPHRPPIFQTSV